MAAESMILSFILRSGRTDRARLPRSKGHANRGRRNGSLRPARKRCFDVARIGRDHRELTAAHHSEISDELTARQDGPIKWMSSRHWAAVSKFGWVLEN